MLDLVDGRLAPERAHAIETHLERCSTCRAIVGDADSGAHAWVSLLARSIQRRPALPAGLVLAERYRIIRLIGRGGMGEVYQATDIELGIDVALKMLHDELAADPRMVSRLKREVQLARLVTHPNVCRVFDLGYHRRGASDELLFITMELLRGETLRQRLLRERRLAPAAALPVVQQIADALTAAHAAGVIHRDFKSDNVILETTTQGVRAVVTDFGLARAAMEEELWLSAGAALIGTAAYIAPEQVLADPITFAVDIYAFGVVMFELVTGQLPFNGRSPLATVVQRLRGGPPSPRAHVAELDPAWEATILRCLQRAPADRFGSAREVALALTTPPPVDARRTRPLRLRTTAMAFALAPLMLLSGAVASDGHAQAPMAVARPAAVASPRRQAPVSASAKAATEAAPAIVQRPRPRRRPLGQVVATDDYVLDPYARTAADHGR